MIIFFFNHIDELGDFLKNLGKLVEDTYTMNGKKKVILLGKYY